MTSATSICSNALLELGKSAIADINSPTNDAERLAANLYAPTRDALLRSHLWNFAIRRVQLSPSTPAPAFGFSNAYLLPGDWLRTLRIGGTRDYVNTDFRQEGRLIVTDASTMFLRYVWRNEDVGTYDAIFVEALTAMLRWKFTYPVTKSTSLRDSNERAFLRVLQQAKSIDAMEEPGDMIAEETPLINVRY